MQRRIPILLLFLSAFPHAACRAQLTPPDSASGSVIIRNAASESYRGTVVTGLPVVDGFPVARLQATLPDGTNLDAASMPLGEGFDGSPRWALTVIHGEFPPGETRVTLHRATGDEAPSLIPRWSGAAFKEAEIRVVEVDFSTGKKRRHTLRPAELQFRPTYQSPVYRLDVAAGAFDGGLLWQLNLERRAGEGGVRCEFLLHNDAAPYFDGRGTKWRQIESAVIETVGAGEERQITVSRGFDPSRRDTILGPIGVVDGCRIGPTRLERRNGRVRWWWLSRVSAIPMGSPERNMYAEAARPGDPPKEGHDPRTARGQVIAGGQKFWAQFFLGTVPPQSHLDCPPTLVWEDLGRYSAVLVGGGAPQGKSYASRYRARYERIRSAVVDPTRCDALAGHNPNTLLGFIERGGTYPREPELNPHFGPRDFGDTTWSSGYAGAQHYQMATHLWNCWLQSRSPRRHDFLRQARWRCRHFRTIDWTHATSVSEPTKYEGKPRYEKGHHHGNYSDTLASHIWTRALCLDYVLTGNPESLDCLDQVRRYIRLHSLLDGTAVPEAWAKLPGRDRRDFGAPSVKPATRPDRGKAAGWQGDWGIRRAARSISILVDDQWHLGRDNRKEIARLLDSVLRVETGVWGGRGVICNRANRGKNYPDHEQVWMHAYLVRAIGKAMHYGGQREQRHVDLYHRMIDVLLNNLAHGKDGVPLRPEAYFDAEGKPIRIMRDGVAKATVELWYGFREKRDRSTFSAWNRAFLADVARIRRESPQIAAWKQFEEYARLVGEMQGRFRRQPRAVVSPDDALFKKLVKRQWQFKAELKWPATNYASLCADALAQAALVFGRDDVRDEAYQLLFTAIYHLDDASQAIRYERPWDNPSPVGYRRAMYPNSEDKILGAQLDTMYMLALMEADHPTTDR